MFGYVRPYKPYLRVCEYEAYKSVYCGVCKSMGRCLGEVSRFGLTYDAAFLSLFEMSVRGIELKAEPQRCIAHPLTKRSCAVSAGTEFAAYASVILMYHKLKDDLADGSLKDRLIARPAAAALTGAYIKARAAYPRLAAVVEKQTKEQMKLEKELCSSLDRAAEPTGQMTRAVFAELGEDKPRKKLLGSFGYFLGRYTYLVDALDDLKKDAASGGYNPLAVRLGLNGSITDEEFEKAAGIIEMNIRLTLGQLAEKYVKLEIGSYKSILDNIIYLGLTDVFEQVKKQTFRKKERKD